LERDRVERGTSEGSTFPFPPKDGQGKVKEQPGMGEREKEEEKEETERVAYAKGEWTPRDATGDENAMRKRNGKRNFFILVFS